MITERRGAVVAAMAVLLIAVSGCYQQQMGDQARYDPLEGSEFFEDGRASRPPVEGTVARDHLRIDEHLYAGVVDGEPATTFPFEVTGDVLERGRERYEIFCTPCHDRVGNGNGIVVQRGFRRPPSFHIQRLQEAPPGYYFDVITRGFGAMSSYASQMPVRDRWAVVAYVRALQLSQQASEEDLTEADLERLETGR